MITIIFATIVATIAIGIGLYNRLIRSPDSGGYQPSWYRGSWNSSNPVSISKNKLGEQRFEL